MIQVQAQPTIRVLEANYLEDTQAVRKDTPAYLLGVAERPNSGSYRVRVYVRARDGRYIAIWQRRALLGKFRPVDVSPLNPAYGFLCEQGDVFGIAQAAAERGEI